MPLDAAKGSTSAPTPQPDRPAPATKTQTRAVWRASDKPAFVSRALRLSERAVDGVIEHSALFWWVEQNVHDSQYFRQILTESALDANLLTFNILQRTQNRYTAKRLIARCKTSATATLLRFLSKPCPSRHSFHLISQPALRTSDNSVLLRTQHSPRDKAASDDPQAGISRGPNPSRPKDQENTCWRGCNRNFSPS
jgi:hypothetical protein